MNSASNAAAGNETGIVLFDGVCNLCSGTVRFIFKRDSTGHFRFGQLQSDVGQLLLQQHRLPTNDGTTVVLIEGTAVYTQSEAFLHIVRRLRPPWPALVMLRIFPRRLRDAVYGFVARHRYQWFGRKTACELPPAELRARFL